MIQDTIQAAVDTVVNLPPVSSGTDLILYWVTLAAGFVSGYAVKGLDKLKKFTGALAEPLKLGIVAGLSFLGVKLAVFFGLQLPENPLAWDAATVNTVLSTILGYAVTKSPLKKKV